MRQPLLLISLSLAALLLASVLGQDKVPVQFQTNPVLVQTGTSIVITLLNPPSTLSITWNYNGTALGLWAGGAPVIDPPAQFQGRVTITSNKLQIGSAQLRDAGTYQADVVPSPSTGLSPNSGSVQLRVFDAVAGVSLFVPSVALEGGNVTLRCTWTAGTEITVQWGKGGSAITADSRITISGGSLVINPASRSDAGQYTCTASNLVSAQTVTQSLTIYYGPDTPVLTKTTPKSCVGGGDVLVGQTVSLTCTAASLPPALFSWQSNGQPITSNTPNSGVLSLQTSSTSNSGQYTCTARNSITGNTSAQSTALAVVDVCLSGGEVAGIVIGSFLGFLIIVFLIILILFLVRKRRAPRRREPVSLPNTNPNQSPVRLDPRPNGVRDLDQGPNPPIYQHNPAHVYRDPRQSRGNLQTPALNGLHNSNTRQHNGRTHTNGLPHNTIQNTNSFPHNGIDNPAFVPADAQNANTLPITQQQNPSILIQTGAAQSGGQPQAVHVSLNALPQTSQPNNNAQLPAIHVNLNPFPTGGQQTQQDSSFPLSGVTNNNASQIPHSLLHAGQSDSRVQSGVPYPSDPRLSGQVNAHRQDQSGHIPTGYARDGSNNTSQRNANTQTYQQELEPHRSSDRNSGRQEATPSSSRRQSSWDLLRGTPTYPNGTREREQTSEYSETTGYTSHPPVREGRTASRSQTRTQRQTASRSSTPRRQDASSADRRTRHHSADFQQVFSSILTQHEPLHRTQRSPHTQRESAQRDIRGSPHSQTAPRQEATHRNNPQALPLTTSAGHSAVSQGFTIQQGPTAPQGADARALADPNHLQQAHMVQQNRTAPIQRVPEGVGTQTAPVTHGAGQPPQRGTAPAPYPSSQPKPSNLTQAALKVHTAGAQTFPNRREQTKAALLHPGTQTQAPAAGAGHPPTPPPVIPLTQFQTLPKKRTHHKSPMRDPHPPRPPVNVPVAQRPDGHRHPAMMPTNHHHHPQTGHVHAGAHRHGQSHVRGHAQPAHLAHQWQQQAHRGRPR